MTSSAARAAPRELERLVDSGKAAVAFSLYPVSVADLMDVSDAGEIMPPKSTWFEPKLRDGLLIHRDQSSKVGHENRMLRSTCLRDLLTSEATMKVLIADKFEQSGIDGLKAAGCDVVYQPDLKDDALTPAIARHRAGRAGRPRHRA